jgi:hypothetical protein
MSRIVLLLVYLTVPAAWAQIIVCPANATDAAPGWEKAGVKGPAAFERISVFDGLPAEMADLAPTGEQTTGTRVTQTWDLTSSVKSRVYLVCRYRGTPATLTRILPATMRQCRLEFTLKGGRIAGTSTMSCR